MDWIRRYWRWIAASALAVAVLLVSERWRIPGERRQDPVIIAAGLRYEMDPALIKAVMWRESRFNPKARGTKGELGLMQLREDAGREWARAEGLAGYDHRRMLEPARNTLAGTWYLRKQMARYAHTDNPVAYALAAYNAGPSNVAKWSKGAAATNSSVFLRQMGFPSTRRYVQSVLERRKRYAKDSPSFAAVPRPLNAPLPGVSD